MLPGGGEIILRRVILRGAEADITSAQGAVKTALEQGDWPTTPAGEIIFLRRISSSGTPREIAARAAEQARRLALSAVEGWSPAAPLALAVRFRSSSALRACLVRDLLAGSALNCWYWRRWDELLQRPASEALASILREEPLTLPAVLEQLRATPQWQRFWQELGDAGAGTVLGCIVRETGWSAALQAALALMSRGVPAGEVAAAELVDIVPCDLSFLAAAADDQRPLLVALVTLWQQAPTLLGRASDGGMQLQRFSGIIAGRAGSMKPEPTEIILLNQSDTGDSPRQPETVAATGPAPLAETAPPLYGSAEPGPLTAVTSLREHTNSSESSRQISVTRHVTVTTEEGGPQNAATVREAVTELPEQTFVTGQGGLFYLLNFLNLPTVRTLLPDDRAGAGWRWLHDLAAHLECSPEGALLDFIALQCGMKHGTELTQSPPSKRLEQIVRMGAGRYGAEVWQAGTWLLPARLIATASHLDLHFRLCDARLAVRRVGLDINPGWLPWLGRVVTFHYGSGREPDV